MNKVFRILQVRPTNSIQTQVHHGKSPQQARKATLPSKQSNRKQITLELKPTNPSATIPNMACCWRREDKKQKTKRLEQAAVLYDWYTKSKFLILTNHLFLRSHSDLVMELSKHNLIVGSIKMNFKKSKFHKIKKTVIA